MLILTSAVPPIVRPTVPGPRTATGITFAPASPLALTAGGAAVAITATPTDAQGAIPGKVVTWNPGNSAVATLATAGNVATLTPVTAGQYVLQASVDGVTASVQVGVATSGAPPSSGTFAGAMYAPLYDLPHRYDAAGVDLGPLRYNAATGSAVDDRPVDATYASFAARLPNASNDVLLVDSGDPATNGANLLLAVQARKNTGGRIRLPMGVEFRVSKLFFEEGTGVISIENAQVMTGAFSIAYGRRLTALAESALPQITTNENYAAIIFGQRAHNIRFTGVLVTIASTFTLPVYNSGQDYGSQGLVLCAPENTTRDNLNGSGYQDPGADLTHYPSNLTFDRCAIRGRKGYAWRFGFRAWSGSRLSVVGCRVYDIGCTYRDSSALQIEYGGAGYLIENSYFSGCRGETVFSGGGVTFRDASRGSVVARDILWVGNLFEQGWKDLTLEHKNLWECKAAIRVLVEGNLFRGYAGTGAYGGQHQAIVVKSHSQEDSSQTVLTTVLTMNITFRRNVGQECCGFLGCAAANEGQNNEPNQSRIEVRHNLWMPPASGTLVSGVTNMIQALGSDYAYGANPFTDATRRVRSVTIAQNTLYGSYAANDTSFFDLPDNDINNIAPLDDVHIVDNIFAQPNAGNGFNQLYFRTDGSQPSNYARDVWAFLAAQGKLVNGTEWAGNLVARAGAVIAGDTGVSDPSALQLDPTTFAPLTGSPALTGATHGGLRGCDVRLLPDLAAITA